MSWNIANPAAAAANSHTTTNSTIQQQQTQAQANLNNSLQNHPNQVVKTTAVTIPQTQQPKIQINTPPPHNILGRANIPIPNPPTRSPISQQQQQQHYTTSLMNNHAAQQHIEKGLKFLKNRSKIFKPNI